jgi:hypothetical protein
MIQCISNLKQIGVGFTLFEHDNGDSFPPSIVHEANGELKTTFDAIGGPDGWNLESGPSTKLRPLYPYIGPSEVYRCAEDKGFYGFVLDDKLNATNHPGSAWEWTGCSYQYNIGAPIRARVPFQIIAGQKVSVIPSPERFILILEPPARSCTHEGTRAVTCVFHFRSVGQGQTAFLAPLGSLNLCREVLTGWFSCIDHLNQVVNEEVGLLFPGNPIIGKPILEHLLRTLFGLVSCRERCLGFAWIAHHPNHAGEHCGKSRHRSRLWGTAFSSVMSRIRSGHPRYDQVASNHAGRLG